MSNWSCSSMNDYLWHYRHDLTTRPWVMAIFGCLYFCIVVLGIFGNLCVVLSVARTPALRTVPNMFIVSLSCSDVVVCLTSATITPITAFTKNWIFGSALCSIAPLISGISLCFSTFTLAAVAIDRFILIAFPTKNSIEPRHAAITIVMIIVLSACLSTPMMLKQNLKSYTGFCGQFCTEEWGEDDTGRRIYGTFMVGLQFVLPLLIITFCYTTISVRLGQSLLLKSQNKHTPMSAQRQSACKRRQRTNRMLIAMVVAFAASWIFNITFNVLRDFDRLPLWAKSQEYLFGIVTHCIAMTSTVWNPLLYAWLNLQLRAAFLELMPKRLWPRRRQQWAHQPAGDESPALVNGRASTMMPGEITRDCATNWKRGVTSQQSETQQQLSDCIRASTANYGTLNDVNISEVYDDDSIELIPSESVAQNKNRRASACGSLRYFVARLSIGGDYHRFVNSVVPHSQPSRQLTTNKERCRKLTATELFEKRESFSREKPSLCRTSSL